MRKEDNQVYLNRISNANATEIIAILYDIIQADFELAQEGLSKGDFHEFKDQLSHASLVLSHLQNALDFQYEISKELYSLYDFAKRSIAKSIYKADLSGIEEANVVLKPLGQAFATVAEGDSSPALMENTQQITAGMTYGPGHINESMDSSSRGFLA